MTRSFEHWFSQQKPTAKPPVVNEDGYADDDLLYFYCVGCGKTDIVTYSDYVNGNTSGWYVDDLENGDGVCGGSQYCLP